MATNYHINPRIRAYGKARIDITRRAKDEKDWQEKWRDQLHSYPFTKGEGWDFCIEYKVDDFAAEVGFFIDFFGFPSSAFSPNYAQFTTPNCDFYFSVSEAQEGEVSTPPDAIRIQFNVADIMEVVKELENRGIEFEHQPQPIQDTSEILVGCFRTPHGVCIDLWGTREPEMTILDDESLDDDELEDVISKILHQAEDEDDARDEVENRLNEGDLENKSKVKIGHTSNIGTTGNDISKRTRFPNSIERLDITTPRTQDSVIGEDFSKKEAFGKIDSHSPGQPNKPDDIEPSYQDLDE